MDFQLLVLLIALISIIVSAVKKYRQAESRRRRPEPSVPPEAYKEEPVPSTVPREQPVPPPLPPLLQRLREEMERMVPPPEHVAEEHVREEPPVEEPPPEERKLPPVKSETVPRPTPRRVRPSFGRLTSSAVVRGIVLSEILGPCRALRSYGMGDGKTGG